MTMMTGRRVDLPTPAAGYRIGEAARLVGVSPSSLRLWERQGLVRPRRGGNGYRRYGADDIELLRRVSRMRRQQVNAPGIRRLIRPRTTALGRDADLDSPIGSRLRRLRMERGLSLREAGRRAGLSTSFLSAVERGAAAASLASLQRLTAAYGVTTLDLFQPASGRKGRRIGRRRRPTLDLPESGVRIEQLAQGATMLEPQLFVLAPGATSDGAYAHDGEEFLYVLDGAVTLWLGERERYRLTAGDALTFPSTLPHRWRNRADGETRLLWINTPPTF